MNQEQATTSPQNAQITIADPRAEVHIQIEGAPVITYLLDLGTYMIGRIPSCGIRVEDRSISREHAVLTFRADGWMIEDLNSRNGTYLENKPVQGTKAFLPDQKLRIGGAVLKIKLLGANAASAAPPALRRGAVINPTAEDEKNRKEASVTLFMISGKPVTASKSQQQRLILAGVLIAGLILALWMVRKRNAANTLLQNSTTEVAHPVEKKEVAFFKTAMDQLNAGKFNEALETIQSAIALAPNEAEYHYWMGNILENFATPDQMEKAVVAYTKALELDRTHRLAKENFDLCIKWITLDKGKPDLMQKSKRELQEAMKAQGRTDESLALYQRMGTHSNSDLILNSQLLLDQASIKGILALDHERLSLDLSNTTVADLGPIQSLPLDSLNLENTPIANLTPLKGLPLRNLNLLGTKVTDLSLLASCLLLENLTLPAKNQCKNLGALRKLPHLQRIGFTNNESHLPNQTAQEFWAGNSLR